MNKVEIPYRSAFEVFIEDDYLTIVEQNPTGDDQIISINTSDASQLIGAIKQVMSKHGEQSDA